MKLGLLLLAMAAGLAGANKPKFTAIEVLEKLLAAQDSQEAMTARVVKEERAEGVKEAASRIEGRLAFMKGGRARLDIEKPSASLVVCDGKKLSVELPEAKQVMRYDAKKLRSSGNFFLDLAASIRHYSRASLKRLVPPGDGFDPAKVSALELLPLKAEAAGFERLRVWVDQELWAVRRAELSYGGTVSRVDMDQVRVFGRGEPAAKPKMKGASKPDAFRPTAAQFDYVAPKGWEVFDLDL